jgi:hypothetical protein
MRRVDRMESTSAWMGRGRWVLSIFAAVVLGVGVPIEGLGDEVKVEFSQGLTNGTGWVYGPKIFFNKSNEAAYIRAEEGGQVISPDFGFAVTSVVIILKNTMVTEKARRTKFSPVVGGVVETNSVWTQEVQASGEKEEVRIDWPAGAGVRAFSFYSGEGSGNTYFYEARILGVGLAEGPVGCRVVATNGVDVSVAWENREGIVSNCVEVERLEEVEFAAEYVTNFTFDLVANGGRQARNVEEWELGEGVHGWVLKVPTNMVGVVQIGSGEVAGGLVVQPGLGTYEGMSLVVRARRYPNKEEGNVMPVQWVAGGVTNELGQVVIGDEMKEYVMGMEGVSVGAEIVVRSLVKKGVYEGGNRRVWVDAVGFAREVREACVVTNLVARKFCSGRARMRVGGLETRTRYRWRVRAFDEEGHGSADMEWMEFETTEAPPPPFIMRLQ